MAQLTRSGVRSRDGRAWLAQGRELLEISRRDVGPAGRRLPGRAGPPRGAGPRGRGRSPARRWGGASTLVADGGDTLTWALAYFDAEAPGRLLSTTTALGTLGVGLPFALAAKAARPEEPVVLLTGDGAFGLSAMEMDTAARCHLPVIVVVANNGGWGDVRHHQREMYGREVASQSSPTPATTASPRPSAATGSGWSRLADLRPALERAAAAGGPALIDVRTDPDVLSALLRAMMMVGIM